MGSPSFFFAEAFRSFRNNFSVGFAAITTVAIAIFLLGAFIAVAVQVREAVDNQKKKIDVEFYLADASTDEQRNDLQDKLLALQTEGLVDSKEDAIVFISKAEALVILRERVGQDVLDQLPTNPLPPSFKVQPSDPANSEEIISRVGDHPALNETEPPRFQKETTDRLLTTANVIQWFGLALILALLLGAILLISNTIRLSIFARRRDIEVMRLVGGTNWFIRWPFVIEGIIVGLVGSIVAVILLLLCKILVVDPFFSETDTGFLTDSGAESGGIGLVTISLTLIVAGAVIGAVGSGLSLRRFLKV